ncbi:MAG: hypothetical protein H6876_07825 [Hyphomicrobiaceae bacterium]|nr:hypothetical protein [Hyphomicrobiaceae bacterium]
MARSTKSFNAVAQNICQEQPMSNYAISHPSSAQMQRLILLGWALATASAFSMIVLVVFGVTAY